MKHPNMPWDYKTKDLDCCPYPFDVRYDRYSLPAWEVLQAQFHVVPHSGGFESHDVFAELIEKPNLLLTRKQFLHRWNDDGLVVISGYRPLSGETEDVIWQIRYLRSFQGLLASLQL